MSLERSDASAWISKGSAFKIAVVMVAILCVLATLQAFRFLFEVLSEIDSIFRKSGDDSWHPMLRALDLLNGPDSARLYEQLFFTLKMKFQYAPTSLIPFEFLGNFFSLTLWNLNAFNATIFVLNAALLATLAAVVLRKKPAAPNRLVMRQQAWLVPIAAFVAGLIFYPLPQALRLGQIQIWVDTAFTIALLLWCLDRRIAAGLALGFASVLKPQFALLLIWGLAWRQWRFLSGFLALVAPIGLLSLFRYGLHNHLAYLDVLSYISHRGEVYFPNNSLNGIVNRLLTHDDIFKWNANEFAPYNPVVYMATIAASIFFISIALVPALRQPRGDRSVIHLGIAVLCFTMASPIAWEHHYGVILPVFIVVLHRCLLDASDQFRCNTAVMLGLSWFLSAAFWPALGKPPLSELTTSAPWNLVHAHLFFGALVLLGVSIAAANRAYRAPVDQCLAA